MGYALALALVLFVLWALGKREARKKATKAKRPAGPSELEIWKASESRDVRRPRDPRAKFCVENLGKEITIHYHGTWRTLTPLRVFTKPKYRKTYVLASENGEEKTFDIDDMAAIAGMKPPRPRRPANIETRPEELVENPDAAGKAFFTDIFGSANGGAKHPEKHG